VAGAEAVSSSAVPTFPDNSAWRSGIFGFCFPPPSAAIANLLVCNRFESRAAGETRF